MIGGVAMNRRQEQSFDVVGRARPARETSTYSGLRGSIFASSKASGRGTISQSGWR
jgi:hypothetical protein